MKAIHTIYESIDDESIDKDSHTLYLHVSD